MDNTSRGKKAKLNIIVSLLCQIVTMICGLITPRLMLRAFGSEINGAITSITTFLGYIILVEGGIGGVARAALYKPLSEGNEQKISEVMAEIKSFFRRVGYIFIFYVLIIACTFKYISHTEILDWSTSFFLVIVISGSTFAQYFIGISNGVLLHAAQRLYISNVLNAITIILNTIFVVILTYIGCDIITIKLISGLIFTLKPIALWIYVKKHYHIRPVKTKTNTLKDKWTGLGQHIAYFLHTHTDVVVLTVFGNLKLVSIYAVYNMVTSAIQNITTSCYSGMDAVFGDMYAKRETDSLNHTFNIYETLISIVTCILFGTAMVLTIPFVKLYTNDITDTNYIEPLFAVLLISSCIIFCLRAPYHNMIISAGHFKQTNIASYGEAIINIVSSIILVIKFGLVGVAIGTVIATLFRFVFYAVYLSKDVLKRKLSLWIKREIVNIATILIIYLCGMLIMGKFDFSSYIIWAEAGIIMAFISAAITFLLNIVFYKNECVYLFGKLKIRRKTS